MPKSLQETYAPNNICFGCGPANPQGLQIRSFVNDDVVIADWQAQPHHRAFAGAISGGIIGTLLDCHSNWTAAWRLMKTAGADRPPCTVTAEYSVKLLRPTPSDQPAHLVARVAESSSDHATVESQLLSQGNLCATFRGTFVAVKPGHPAYHRW